GAAGLPGWRRQVLRGAALAATGVLVACSTAPPPTAAPSSGGSQPTVAPTKPAAAPEPTKPTAAPAATTAPAASTSAPAAATKPAAPPATAAPAAGAAPAKPGGRRLVLAVEGEPAMKPDQTGRCKAADPALVYPAKKIDHYTVDLSSPDPDPLLPTKIIRCKMPAPNWLKTTPAETLAVTAVGTGPYVLVEWKK